MAVTAYANSFRVPFFFDDIDSIVENPTIRRLWPPWPLLSPPPQTTVAGRPILNLSLALCFAMSGLNVWSYHALNILLHIACGMVLFAMMRRILSSPRLADRFSSWSAPLELCVTLLWVVHPINTMCVTYIIQRAESLVSLCLLATLYCSIRAVDGRHAIVWNCAAVACCALGMGCKELMVVAPLLVMLLDHVLYFDSARTMLRQRWPLYLGLCTTWIILFALIASGPRSESAGLNLPFHRTLDYLRTQPGVLLHYLRLIVWPHPLILDYEWPLAYRLSDAIGSIVLIVPALLFTAWGLLRRRPWALLPGWFFILLAPTSSFVPIVIVASEHRVYLPMVAVIFATILIAEWLLSQMFSPLAKRLLVVVTTVVLCATLIGLTHARNKVYRDGVTTWSDVVAKRPQNPRAHMNLAANLYAQSQTESALLHLDTAIRLMPGYADAHYNLGTTLADLGRLDEAAAAFREAIRLKPMHAAAHYNLGHALMIQGRHEESLPPLGRAVELKPDHAKARADLGISLALLGRKVKAVPHLREAVRLDKNNPSTLNTLAWILATHPRDDLRDGAEALRLSRAANRLLGERDPAGLDTLAAAYAEMGKFDEAVETMDRALTLAASTQLQSLIDEFRTRRDLYLQKKPYREQR